MKRPRLTIRRLMIAVAVVALTLGGVGAYRRLIRKATDYRALAREHADTEQTLRRIIEKDGPDAPVDISPGPGIRSKRFTAKSVAEFQAALAGKYEHAARHPWLPVEADPPEPE